MCPGGEAAEKSKFKTGAEQALDSAAGQKQRGVE